jgi:beta-lactamase regulating signal transducer with metallopeptidase domain
MPALALEAIQGISGRLLWLSLLHSLWLGLILAALVALVFQVRWTLTHRARHAILLTALCLVAAGPPALTVAQYCADWRQSGRDAILAKMAVAVQTEPTEARGPAPSVATATPRREEASSLTSLVRSLLIPLDKMTDIARTVRPYALTAWSVIVLTLTAVLPVGLRGLNRLRRDASSAPEPVQKRAQRLGRLLRLRTIPAIRVHATLGEPCLCGLFRPFILLPGHWLATAGPESLDAVLAHELAHARRYDHVVNLAQRALEALLFFHPGVHWLSRSLRRQREHCADALAVRMTGNPLALARALEALARARPGPSMAARSVGAALNGESPSLLPRIQELIGMMPTRPRSQVWPFAALLAAAAFALVAISTGFAQDGSPPKQGRPPAPAKASRTASPGQYGAPAVKHFDRQISYEVRYIDLDAQPWRDHSKDRLTPAGFGAGVPVWIIDHPGLTDLLNHVRAAAEGNVFQFPKPTGFEGSHVTFLWDSSGFDLRWEADDIKDITPTRREARPVVIPKPARELKDLKEGSRLDIQGVFSSQGTRLSVDLRDSTIADLGKAPKGGAKPGTSQKPPAAGEIHYQGSCDVPTRSSLLISLGQYQHSVGDRSVAIERLVVITPRLIVLEPDLPVAARANDRATSRPAPRPH